MANLVYLAGSAGHPQLVQAAILHMRSAGWSRGAVRALVGGEAQDIEDERRAARDRLVAALPEGARVLLLRTSIVVGRFPRNMALALADVERPVPSPGLELDRLIGPWIERPAHDRLRVSPLVATAGSQALSPAEQVRVHRAVANHLLRAGSISVSQNDALLHHALAGGDEAQMAACGDMLVRAPSETLELLARHSPAVAALETDRPIVPGRPTLNAMLRLGQLLVALSGDDAARTGEIWRAMRTEMTAPGVVGFETVVLSKILITTHITHAIPEWVDLLVRFDELYRSDERLKDWADGTAVKARYTKGDIQGFAFVHQATSLNSTAALRACLERLDAVAPDVRQRMFSALRGEIGHFGHLADSACFRSVNAGEIDGDSAAADYLAMAELAHRWGEVELAARCHAARAIMLDERADAPDRALAALDEAARQLGPSPTISRARAKVHWRSRDHVTALRELEEVWADPRAAGDRIERGFVAREAAISAAETGRWAMAQMWFDRSRDAFAGFSVGTIPNIWIGLGADAAQAAFMAGDVDAAIAGYARALEELADVDPESSLRAGYLHRVVRHATLWLMANARPEKLDLGEIGHLPPGACSNPDPPEAILERPLGPLDLAWYLLADAALDLGNVAFFRDLHGRLADGPILGLEVTRRKKAADHAIASADAAAVAAALVPYSSGMAYLHNEKETLAKGDLMNPTRGELPALLLDGSEPNVARSAAVDLLVCFGMLRAMAGDVDAVRALRGTMGGPERLSVRLLVKLMAGAEGEASNLAAVVATSIATVAGANGLPVDPAVALAATVRFALWVRASEFQGQRRLRAGGLDGSCLDEHSREAPVQVEESSNDGRRDRDGAHVASRAARVRG